MWRWFYQESGTLDWALLALVVFIASFTIVVLRAVFSRTELQHAQEMSRLPLDDGEPVAARRS